jgi:MFS family permease
MFCSRTKNHPSPSGTKHRHYVLASLLFLALGAHVGVWAVQLSDLAREFNFSPGELGGLLAVPASAGLITLFVGGYLADRLGRRPVLLIGLAGTACSFVLLSQTTTVAALVLAVLLYGLFFAWFSFGALAAAVATGISLAAGVDFRAIYVSLAVLLLSAALVSAFSALPAPIKAARVTLERRKGQGQVWRMPGVGIAILMVCICFFGDGALESFLSVYLRDALDTGPLMAGIGIGSFHLASLLGRLLSAKTQDRIGERRVLVFSALLAAAGIAIAVATRSAAVAMPGILLVGFAIAPVVPMTLSLAARAAPGRSGQAVGLATAIVYGWFIVSPVLVGALASMTSIRFGLGALIATALMMAIVAAHWPRPSSLVGADSRAPATQKHETR